jgi:mannose-1-phosphate guanylyltransferase
MNRNGTKEFPSFTRHLGSPRSERHAVILAGGEGSRLRSLTRVIAGDERPKQFCPILNDRTLLEETRDRVALKIKPENTFFSLTQQHEIFYRNSLWDVPEPNRIVQPENKGTAPAILYSVMRVAKTASRATVAFFPSDHYLADSEAFMETVEAAYRAVDINPNSVILLGIEPAKAETSYGWIEPVESLFGDISRSVSRVKRFWEKPSYRTARTLMKQGCLWNSFVMIGKVETFLSMFRKHLPDMYRIFEASGSVLGKAAERPTIRSIYDWINETNFSSAVLEKASGDLLVQRVGDVGWSDWGEPQRVVGTLSGLGVETDWMHAPAAG